MEDPKLVLSYIQWSCILSIRKRSLFARILLEPTTAISLFERILLEPTTAIFGEKEMAEFS